MVDRFVCLSRNEQKVGAPRLGGLGCLPSAFWCFQIGSRVWLVDAWLPKGMEVEGQTKGAILRAFGSMVAFCEESHLVRLKQRVLVRAGVPKLARTSDRSARL